ncbi:MAG: discoidin domain-containing protein [Bacillota bacterium]
MRLQLSRRRLIEQIAQEVMGTSGGGSTPPTDSGTMPYPNYASRADLPASTTIDSIAFVKDEDVFVVFNSTGWQDTGISWSDISANFATKTELAGKLDKSTADTLYAPIGSTGDSGTQINDANPLATTTTYSASKIENELKKKAEATHSHDTDYSPLTHTHDQLHTHTNKAELDRLGVSVDGTQLLIDGTPIVSEGSGSTGGSNIPVYATLSEVLAPNEAGLVIIAEGKLYKSALNGLGSDIIPAMTGQTTEGATITASSHYSTSEAWKVADDIGGSSGWMANSGPAWVQVDLGTPKSFAGISLMPPQNESFLDRGPKDFSVLISDNGVDWTSVLDITGETSWESLTPKLFEFPSGAVTARYMKLDILSNGGNAYHQIIEMELLKAKVEYLPSHYSVVEADEKFALKTSVGEVPKKLVQGFTIPAGGTAVMEGVKSNFPLVNIIKEAKVSTKLNTVNANASASSEYSTTTNAAWKSMDGSLSTNWRAANTDAPKIDGSSYWQYTFDSPQTVTDLVITNHATSYAYTPTELTVLVSADGVNFTEAERVPLTLGSNVITLSVAQAGIKAIRLSPSKNNGGTYYGWQPYEIVINGSQITNTPGNNVSWSQNVTTGELTLTNNGSTQESFKAVVLL